MSLLILRSMAWTMTSCLCFNRYVFPFSPQADREKWEAKLLETRVAEFARAPGADDTPSGSQPSQHVPPNGHNTSAHPTQTGYDGLHVKAEPEDPLRLRGGAVRGSTGLSNLRRSRHPR